VTWHQRMWKYHFAFTSAKRLKRNEKSKNFFFAFHINLFGSKSWRSVVHSFIAF
jgi:hypothetical protein